MRPVPWILPAAGVVGAIVAYPGIRTVYLSLTDRSGFGGGEFVGLDNFASLARSDVFWLSFKNNILLLLSVPLVLVVAAIACGALYGGIRGASAYESAIFVPYLPAVASVGAIFIYMLGPSGPVNGFLSDVGLEHLQRAWLSEPGIAIWSIFAVMAWKRLGFTVLLLMGRLTAIDREMMEAAAVDGATWWTAYRRVALPQCHRTLAFAGIVGMIEVFAYTFAFVFVLTGGGPNQATYTLDIHLYNLQFTQQLTALASAVAVILLLCACATAIGRIALERRSL